MEVDARFSAIAEDGFEKTKTEKYVVDAMSFTEAEKKTIDFLKDEKDLKVVAIKQARYNELVFKDDDSEDKWWKVKVKVFCGDSEKPVTVQELVQASSVIDAQSTIAKLYNGIMADYSIATIDETKVIDIIVE
jgi:hypothetical protein